mgnify:CR=1 FL=1
MAYSTTIRILLLVLLIFFAHFNISSAIGYRGVANMHRKINSRELLRQLSFELSKMKDDNDKDDNAKGRLTDLPGDRLVPEGPDPHHHYNSPMPGLS